MSGADQPLFAATMGYHVGHSISVTVARDQGYYAEEGLGEIEFDGRGLLPRRYEREALALTMEERGVDLALGVGPATAFWQRAHGADLYIVGGWRLDGPAGTRWYARDVAELAAVRGLRAGIREPGSMNGALLAREAARIGIDPVREISWTYDAIFYGDNPAALEALAAGRVDLIALRPAAWAEADRRGFRVLLDSVKAYPNGRPGRVIVATGRTIRERRADLAAFLRANLRAFWFVRDVRNYDRVCELDARARRTSHNEEEHTRSQLVTVPEDCETWPMPLDGGVDRDELARMMEEDVRNGTIERALPLAEVLVDDIVRTAYRELASRPASRAALEHNAALRSRFGF